MDNANIGWLFYKEYFRGLNDKNMDEDIQQRVDTILKQSIHVTEDETLGNIHFEATTTYPGLLLGSGYMHELPSVEGQIILGFYFDYTSGLPVIQGSSIKGVLRSAFRYPSYIQESIKKEVDVEALENEIFNNKDVFFDATIISDGKILGDDYITPHEDPLKNPKILRFIKVLPGTKFRFDFMLSDGLLSKDEKLKLFMTILGDFGVGAKTNVGYGKFKDIKRYKTKEEEEQERRENERQKEQERLEREREIQQQKEQKKQKATEGIARLNSCKTPQEAFNLLRDAFGKHPKLTDEEKEQVEKFKAKCKNLSKKDEKTFRKYLK